MRGAIHPRTLAQSGSLVCQQTSGHLSVILLTDAGFVLRIMVDMATHLGPISGINASGIEAPYPIGLSIEAQLASRNRLTTAFRPLLAIPHIVLVGGPVAFATMWFGSDDSRLHLGTGAGALGAVAAVCALVGWFAIVFGVRYPTELWRLTAYYLRWRVRAVAYFTLLRDEYPPFGEGEYPVAVNFEPPAEPRDRLSVAFRPLLVLPHLVVLWVLGVMWAVSTCIAWFSILLLGFYPERLYRFAVGVFRWGTRVEAYMLLLRDEYPPFSME
jgi:hypothetical protein